MWFRWWSLPVADQACRWALIFGKFLQRCSLKGIWADPEKIVKLGRLGRLPVKRSQSQRSELEPLGRSTLFDLNWIVSRPSRHRRQLGRQKIGPNWLVRVGPEPTHHLGRLRWTTSQGRAKESRNKALIRRRCSKSVSRAKNDAKNGKTRQFKLKSISLNSKFNKLSNK